MRWIALVLALAPTLALAQAPSAPPTPAEMNAIVQAVAKQRDSAQSLHAQCELDAAKLREQITKLEAELKAAKPDAKPKP